VQLGLTATPKRKGNVDTYKYFGEPVYIYSLREGINDGFLTPFKVRQIATTIDDYLYTPDDVIVEGEVVAGKRYVESEFNKIILIPEREMNRVNIFMDAIDQKEKTIVFCATQKHALMVRDFINQSARNKDPHYCVRVTADEGDLGEQRLEEFRDNSRTIPTILTTSKKLSTGVDARNIRNIVLMRPINSIIEFKQIIGRGTRLFDGKDYFTIYDFVKAYQHFNDPEWDGEPLEPAEPVTPRQPCGGDEEPTSGDGEEKDPPDGKERAIQHMIATSFWGPDGKPMSATQFVERLFGELPALFKSEDELRALWSEPETRRKLLEALSEKGFGDAQLVEIKRMVDAEKSDLYDVLAYIAFALAPITREERVNTRKDRIYSAYEDEKLRTFLDFVLGEYVKEGVAELDQEKLPQLLALKYRAVNDAARELGGIPKIRETFVGFQKFLYERVGN
jgi:type I restriction enzyme, R subunit